MASFLLLTNVVLHEDKGFFLFYWCGWEQGKRRELENNNPIITWALGLIVIGSKGIPMSSVIHGLGYLVPKPQGIGSWEGGSGAQIS